MSRVRRKFRINEFVELVTNEPSLLSKLDPLEIPEVNVKNFVIKEGQVRGLSGLYRYGDCTLDIDGEVAEIGIDVAVRNLTITLTYAAWALFFWIKGHATVSVSDLAVEMDVSAKDGKIKLESIVVLNLGKYEIKKITGMSFVFNWLLKLITNAVANVSRSKIINAIEEGLATAIENLLNAYQHLSGYVSTAMKCMSYLDNLSPHLYDLWDILELLTFAYFESLSITDSNFSSSSLWDFLSNFASDYQESLGFSISFGIQTDNPQ